MIAMLTYTTAHSAPRNHSWLGPLLMILGLLLAIAIGLALKNTQENSARIYMPEDLARMRRLAAAAAAAQKPVRVRGSPQVKKLAAVPETYKLDTRLDKTPPESAASSPDITTQGPVPVAINVPTDAPASDTGLPVTPTATTVPEKPASAMKPAADPASSTDMTPEPPAKVRPVDAKPSADQWISDIQTLKQAGQIEEAASSLQRFKTAYPDYPVPEGLQ